MRIGIIGAGGRGAGGYVKDFRDFSAPVELAAITEPSEHNVQRCLEHLDGEAPAVESQRKSDGLMDVDGVLPKECLNRFATATERIKAMKRMFPWLTGVVCAGLLCVTHGATDARAAETGGDGAGPVLTLVEAGRPRAEIVVAENCPRMTVLAALELQFYLERMSGARLPIVREPSGAQPVRVFIGRSAATDKLGVTDEGLRDGAYRIVSGPDWLVLLGRDFDFDPPFKPWPLSRRDVEEPVAAWEEAIREHTDTAWSFPFRSGYKMYWNPNHFKTIMADRYGEDNAAVWQPAEGASSGFWEFDVGGSLNAVYAFLRERGVRWYMPGELGEVVPEMKTIAVAPLREESRPAFAVRGWLWYNFAGFSFDDIMWSRRLGMNSGYEKIGVLRGPHGLVSVHGHKAMQEAHPEYYALIGGEHDTKHRGFGTANFMSKGLERETVNYIRFLFDQCDVPAVDIWPGDGIMLSQDAASKGKTSSELVWGFVDRVAREVYKTHPDRYVIGGAYTTYSAPPDTIKKFSPNVVVNIANRGRVNANDPEHWALYRKLVEDWEGKVASGNILRYENNRVGLAAPFVFPTVHPRAIVKDLRFLKGKGMGERGEVSQRQMRWHSPGHIHLPLYVQARFLWDPDQDLDAMLEEYFQRFYGPAAKQMQDAFTFLEEALEQKTHTTLAAALQYRDLLEAARSAAGDTVYGERIQILLGELKPRDALVEEYEARQKAIAQYRDNARVAVGVDGADLSRAERYELKDNRTGEAPELKTTFRVGWDGDALIVDIRCQDPDTRNLSISSDVYGGDYVAISLETPLFSFYHIEVNPDGEVADGNPGPRQRTWKSLAEVETERGPDFWRVIARIPVVGADEADADPHHRVAGHKPTPDAPWYFNVGRNRPVGAREVEMQAFSPTEGGWRVPVRFGRLEIR